MRTAIVGLGFFLLCAGTALGNDRVAQPNMQSTDDAVVLATFRETAFTASALNNTQAIDFE